MSLPHFFCTGSPLRRAVAAAEDEAAGPDGIDSPLGKLSTWQRKMTSAGPGKNVQYST